MYIITLFLSSSAANLTSQTSSYSALAANNSIYNCIVIVIVIVDDKGEVKKIFHWLSITNMMFLAEDEPFTIMEICILLYKLYYIILYVFIIIIIIIIIISADKYAMNETQQLKSISMTWRVFSLLIAFS
ncbi:MAG: hypothetical protein ACI8RD_004799 [Bacillariaceae sp.]